MIRAVIDTWEVLLCRGGRRGYGAVHDDDVDKDKPPR